MTVFIAQGWMRWPLRCRARKNADYGWNVREPRDQGQQTPARRADGPSACPGGSPSEPGGVSTKGAIPGDMQQAAKSIRVRNAGRSTCFCGRPVGPWRNRARRIVCSVRTHTPCTAKVHGCHVFLTWRRGRGETPERSARPFGGDVGTGRTGKPWGRSEHGAMTRVCRSDAPAG